MPSKFHWKPNRSHSSADSSSGHPSPVPSVNNEAAAQLQQAQQHQQQHTAASAQPPVQQQQQQQEQQQQVYIQQQQQFPSPTTSHRHSSHLSIDQTAQATPQPGSLAQQSPSTEQGRDAYQAQAGVYNVQAEPPQQKKSLRSRIAHLAHGHHHHKDASDARKNNGLGRSVSLRKSDGTIDSYSTSSQERLQPAKWNRQGSTSHLATSTEQDEDNLDPFLQHHDREVTPQPPPKDIVYQQRPQQFAANSHAPQYSRPALARVDTEESGSYRSTGGVDQYSPDQHQGTPSQQPPPQQQQQQQQQHHPQYQSYQSQVVQLQPGANDYQPFNSQTNTGPHPNASQIPQEIVQQQQGYYPRQQQQQQQQQQFAAQPQPPLGQNYPSQLGQHNRPTSGHQQELQHTPAAHQITQLVQQGQHIDTQHLQGHRPSSSHQQFVPPSPVQQPPAYQTYDPQQQGHTTQPSEPQVQTAAAHQQGQDSMAPTDQPRNTLRKVNDAGAPSREASLLQQPSAQGQTLGHPPVSPGVATFGANVVPTASQGQPYRGEKGQPGQRNESGRATPPPRNSASDLTDEQVGDLMRKHEELLGKYQKVKRYFFEQQNHVHQLQNTLANQRLSLSRTSWDDGEYTTRFSRLDGLIAQLSFAIRKDWKSIPPWLQTVVNKNAVETGKQEMTAVGRAFISHWLVENIFDKYFHPDVEPGLSTQLKTIQLNIRRFSPPCATTDDEDGLVAKIVNWRLATLEGLAEQLRSPQAAQYRDSLTQTLNESLIGSLQMFMNDPAPADLNGGVPMIIELAISVAQHLPLESREVHIEYFPPGHSVVSEFMKVETGIPALTSPILDAEDAASLRTVASKGVDGDNASIGEQEGQQQVNPAQSKEGGEKKRGMFGFGSKKGTQPAHLAKRESSVGSQGGGSQQSLTPNPSGNSGANAAKEESQRVRMAVGVALQIRGKSVLIKAPVYSV